MVELLLLCITLIINNPNGLPVAQLDSTLGIHNNKVLLNSEILGSWDELRILQASESMKKEGIFCHIHISRSAWVWIQKKDAIEHFPYIKKEKRFAYNPIGIHGEIYLSDTIQLRIRKCWPWIKYMVIYRSTSYSSDNIITILPTNEMYKRWYQQWKNDNQTLLNRY